MKTLSHQIIRDMPDQSRIIAELEIRGEDSTLSAGFSLCGSLYESHGTWSGKAQHENDRDIDSGGQIRGDLLRAFPFLEDFARMHLSDLDGVPMHAIANGLYFYRYARDIPQQYGFDNKYGEAQREGFEDPRDYARDVTCKLLRIDSTADLDAIPYEDAKQFSRAFAQFCDEQRARWREESERVQAWLVNRLEKLAREKLSTDNPNEPSGQWSAYDLGKAIHTSTETAESILELVCPKGGRYVGGTSKYLYDLPYVQG